MMADPTAVVNAPLAGAVPANSNKQVEIARLRSQASALKAELGGMVAKLPWGFQLKDTTSLVENLLKSYPHQDWTQADELQSFKRPPNAPPQEPVADWKSLATSLEAEAKPFERSTPVALVNECNALVTCMHCSRSFLASTFGRHPKGCRLLQEQKKAREQARKAAELTKQVELQRAAAEAKAARAREHLQKQQQNAEALRRKKQQKRQNVDGSGSNNKVKIQRQLGGGESFSEKKRRGNVKQRSGHSLEGSSGLPQMQLPWSAIKTDSAGNIKEVLSWNAQRAPIQPLAMFRWPIREATQLHSALAEALAEGGAEYENGTTTAITASPLQTIQNLTNKISTTAAIAASPLQAIQNLTNKAENEICALDEVIEVGA